MTHSSQTDTHAHIHTSIHTHIHTHTRTHVTYTHPHMHIRTHKYIRTRIRAYIHTYKGLTCTGPATKGAGMIPHRLPAISSAPHVAKYFQLTPRIAGNTRKHTINQTQTHTHSYAYICTYLCVCVCIYPHTHTETHRHTNTHTYITYSCKYLNTRRYMRGVLHFVQSHRPDNPQKRSRYEECGQGPGVLVHVMGHSYMQHVVH